MAVVTMRQLLESGVHFGHQTRRWNPKMKRFIMTERNGIYIIDLQQSLTYINNAYEFVKETVAHGGTILFVGTKKQAQEPIAEQATRVGMPYVNHRWLGGMLTNFHTISKRLTRLKELEEIDFDDVAGSGSTKKELLIFKREKDKLERTLGGIRTMAKVPSAVWIVDTKKEHLAVDEARKLGLPVIAILDTNCDPDEVDYKIPGNDDAIRSVTLLTRVIADAVAEGLDGPRRCPLAAPVRSGVAADEPLAEWERELLWRGRRRGRGRWPRRPARPPRPLPTAEAVEAEVAEALPRRPPRRRRRGRTCCRGAAEAAVEARRPPTTGAAEAAAEEAVEADRRRGRRAPRPRTRRGRGPAERRIPADAALSRHDRRQPERDTKERQTTMANYTAADIKALREQTARRND